MEDNLLALSYGEKAAMPATKNLIVSIQGGLMALVTSYGWAVSAAWDKACDDFKEIKGMKEATY